MRLAPRRRRPSQKCGDLPTGTFCKRYPDGGSVRRGVLGNCLRVRPSVQRTQLEVTMIDTRSRRKVAELLRRFRDGEISDVELERAYPASSPDRAIHEVYAWLVGYFSDTRTTYFVRTGHPSDATLDRCIAFLQTDIEYTHASFSWIGRIFDKLKRREWKRGGDNWPF